MPTTHKYCVAEDCIANGRHEFAGYCSDCWIRIPLPARNLLTNTYVEKAKVIERVRVVYPVKHWLLVLGNTFWRISITGLVGYLLWKTKQ